MTTEVHPVPDPSKGPTGYSKQPIEVYKTEPINVRGKELVFAISKDEMHNFVEGGMISIYVSTVQGEPLGTLWWKRRVRYGQGQLYFMFEQTKIFYEDFD